MHPMAKLAALTLTLSNKHQSLGKSVRRVTCAGFERDRSGHRAGETAYVPPNDKDGSDICYSVAKSSEKYSYQRAPAHRNMGDN
jgi:hypothetical protein